MKIFVFILQTVLFLPLISTIGIGAVESNSAISSIKQQQQKSQLKPKINDRYIQQRKKFQKAERLISRPYSAAFVALEAELKNYPLLPYLKQRILLNNLSIQNTQLIRQFLKKYDDTPLERPLRSKWLNFLAKRNKHQLFIDFYQPSSNKRLVCLNYQYQLELGIKSSQILPKITELWLVGKSQPRTCDVLFDKWEASGFRTQERILERIILAATKGKHTLIPYLTTLLTEDTQYLGKLWHRVRRDPFTVSRLNRFPLKNNEEARIVVYGLKRLIWRDPNRAIRSFNLAIKHFSFSEAQLQEVIARFAVALASKKHKAAYEWLHKVNNNNLTQTIIQWRLATALKTLDWKTVKKEINELPQEKQAENNWQYWLARSLIETGDRATGEAIYRTLAQKRHYYGFLAAGHLKQTVQLESEPLQLTSTERKTVISFNALKRAFELFRLKRFVSARREWNYVYTKLSDRQKLVASKMATEIGWYDRAIFTLSDVGYLNDIGLRFPEAFKDDFLHYSKSNNVDPAWAFAVARRESSFMTDASSSAGAKGLMQVLPNTAGKRFKHKKSQKLMFHPKTNISLGTKHLGYLFKRYKGNLVLASAAYNAGSHRIKAWLKNQKKISVDIWIETIPFKETREYVKSVLAYKQIYLSRDNPADLMFSQLVTMEIGK